MHLRPAELHDAEAIAAIYNAEVLGSTATFDLVPRTVEEQRNWLLERSGALAVLVAVDPDVTGDLDVVGYASLSKFRERPAYSTTVETSVYVHSDHRRKGIAKLLMVELMETAKSHGFHTLIARIADSQEASQRLHEELGFSSVGVEREIGRKFNRWLDVTVMQIIL